MSDPIDSSLAFSLIDNNIQPAEPLSFDLLSSLHLILAEDVFSEYDQPPFDQSAIDGFALGEKATQGSYRIVGEWLPGEPSPAKAPGEGEAYQVFTGTNLPPECCLVMVEDTHSEGNEVQVESNPSRAMIRTRGKSVSKGQLLVAAGTRIRAGEIALLASNGVGQISCSPSPRLVHITTGREIVAHTEQKELWQTYNSNHPLLTSMLKRDGYEAPSHVHIGEDSADLVAQIRAREKWDFLFISGGASVGKYDNTAAALEQEGFTIHFHKVNVRPGKPLIFAQRGRQWAFGIPGNPVSHFATYYAFLRPALARFSGQTALPKRQARLSEGVKASKQPREIFWPARLGFEKQECIVTPLPWIHSGDLASLRQANALIHFPRPTNPTPKGEIVRVLPTGGY